MSKIFLIVAALLLALSCAASAENTLPLSKGNWRVWLDESAAWRDDKLFLPDEVNLPAMPVNAPTCGWAELNGNRGVKCELPATVEELFSGGVNAYRYHGVSWFWREVTIPADWNGKNFLLKAEKQRMRMEVYVNGKLAGYDLIPETPCEFDLTRFLKAGAANQLAIRITNAGGNLGWEDWGFIEWGKYEFPASHDFCGLGHVTLEAVAPVYVSDVFVKNLLPAGARNIEARVTVKNDTAASVRGIISVSVAEKGKQDALCEHSLPNEELKPGENAFVIPLTVPKAKLWDIDQPNLYECKVSLASDAGVSDARSVRFGFRVFEVKEVAGEHNFYFNGKRIRHRSAIDWGYYALSGLYPTDEMAKKSVLAARAIGHNGINLHRRIGEPQVMEYADELGLYLYEEPGGFHIGQFYDVKDDTFASKVEIEKCRRMFLRDRNHPSLIIYNLCNEDNGWNKARETVMKMSAELDGTRMVFNTSGARCMGYEVDAGTPQDDINHIRPYEKEIRRDYHDDHTVCNMSRFREGDLASHQEIFKGRAQYWGEVRSNTGPANWWLISETQKSRPDNTPGYDLNIYRPIAEKLEAYFHDFRLADTGSRIIKSPADISRQAGLGLMYIDGRLSQTIMRNNAVDGYAINGWSAGCQMAEEWDSAICDEGRNVKGPVEAFAYWTRPLQIAIARKNGKYFEPGQKAEFSMSLINEGILAAGDYLLKIAVEDGAGKATAFAAEFPVHVEGGDTFAQSIATLSVPMAPEWKAGHVTVEGKLTKNGKTIAGGSEQILLKNRETWAPDLAGLKGAVYQWPAAEQALKEAGAVLTAEGRWDYIAMGGVPDPAVVDKVLKAVREDGSLLLLKFDPGWAQTLLDRGVLTSPVTAWGGKQGDGWNGNGWGYLDHFIGDQAVPSKTTIGTTSWEAPSDPVGFWPLETQGKKYAYGTYLARTAIQTGNEFSVAPSLIQNTEEKELYSSCYYGLTDINLEIPNGTYRVTLKFCETYHDNPGGRMFNISVQGTSVATNLDLVAKVGKYKPLDIVTDQVKVVNGRLTIDFGGSQSVISGMVVEGTKQDGSAFTRKIRCGRDAFADYGVLKPSERSLSAKNSLLILIGALDYGKGKIILDASYPVDDASPLNDMLFFNMIGKGCKGAW